MGDRTPQRRCRLVEKRYTYPSVRDLIALKSLGYGPPYRFLGVFRKVDPQSVRVHRESMPVLFPQNTSAAADGDRGENAVAVQENVGRDGFEH